MEVNTEMYQLSLQLVKYKRKPVCVSDCVVFWRNYAVLKSLKNGGRRVARLGEVGTNTYELFA
jgi:hypothetical protein